MNDCEGCSNEDVPGVIFPIATNTDESKDWIERCDECQRFEGDDEAAEALVAAGVITSFNHDVPVGMDPNYPSPYGIKE